MATSDNDDIDLIEMLRTLWRSKYLVIAITAVFGLGSIYLALTAQPIFRAEVAVIKVDDEGMGAAASLANQFGGLGRLVGIGSGQGGPGQEAQAILESRNLAELFIIRHEILNELAGEDGAAPSLWQGVKRFREIVLSVRVDDTSGIIGVAMEWTDPEVAAKWANDYVALANEFIRERALNESQGNIDYLRDQAEKTSVVELERVIYSLIESELQKLMLANARAEYAFAVVDPAVPPELRSRPKRTLMVLTGGTIGFLLAIFFVLVLNFVRKLTSVPESTDGVRAT